MPWLLEPAKWDALGRRLIQIGEFGTDSETCGQPDKTSPQHRARVHCWSVAVLTGRKSPRGYNLAQGVVLPAEALASPALRDAFANPDVRKWAHNAPHDYHAFVNEGLEVNNMEDTLQWLRVAVPGVGKYGLKDAAQWALGKPERPDFTDMMSYRDTVVRYTRRKEKSCVCGKRPCRAKATSDWFDPHLGWWRLHERVETVVETPHTKEVTLKYPVTAFVPGAQLLPLVWKGKELDRSAAWEEYSLADAVDDIELVSWLRSRPSRAVAYPWGHK